MTEPYYRQWENLHAASDLARGDLLFVAPHPDDEVIGGGGLIIAHRDAGRLVRVVVMTDGRLGDYGGEHGDEYVDTRKRECRAAATALGGAVVEFFDYPDFGLKDIVATPNSEPVSRLRTLLLAHEYATLAFPSPWELHPDHRATTVAVVEAVRNLPRMPRLLAYEVGSFMPNNMLVDISGVFERKIDALRCYASQLEHNDIVVKVSGLDAARTANVDDKTVTHAEAWTRIDAARLDEFLDSVTAAARVTDDMGPPSPWESE